MCACPQCRGRSSKRKEGKGRRRPASHAASATREHHVDSEERDQRGNGHGVVLRAARRARYALYQHQRGTIRSTAPPNVSMYTSPSASVPNDETGRGLTAISTTSPPSSGRAHSRPLQKSLNR